MAAWLRVLANPKILARFLSTKAGKRATLKYGKMLLNSQMARSAVNKFMDGSGRSLSGNKEYKQLTKDYEKLQSRTQKLEAQLAATRDNNDKLQALTFSLGRTVVQMQQTLTQMQNMYQQHLHQAQIAMANSHTR